MNNKKRNKAVIFIFFLLSTGMLATLLYFVFSPATSVKTVSMQSDKVSSYMNNSVRKIVSEVVGVVNARVLPYDFSAASEPDYSKFVMSEDQIGDYYKDSTIEVRCWKQFYGNVPCWFADVKIKHASQFRRQWSNGDYESKHYQYPSNMFKSSNGIVGMSADFYKNRRYGIVVQYGTVICNKIPPYQRLDVLTIDYNGDFKIWKDTELNQKIKEEGADDIMLSFTFGPVIVQDGKAVDPSHWEHQKLGELDGGYGRAAIGQKGELHYLLCTTGLPGMKCKKLSEVMEDQGCEIAYNLDGGQSGTLLFNGGVYNEIAHNGAERAMSDILYFGSSE